MAICSEGKQAIAWKEILDTSGKSYIHVKFSATDCKTCPARSRCTRVKTNAGRRIRLLPQLEFEALEQARKAHDSPERYMRTAGIEGKETLSQGVRSFGLRRSRYQGLAKTHLHNVAIGAAINIVDCLINLV